MLFHSSLKFLYFVLAYTYVDEDVVDVSELNYLRNLCWILSVNPYISLSPWSSTSHPALNPSSPAQPLARRYASRAILTLYFGQQVPALSSIIFTSSISLSTPLSLSVSPYDSSFHLFSYHVVLTLKKIHMDAEVFLLLWQRCPVHCPSVPFFPCTLPLSAFSTFTFSVLHTPLMYLTCINMQIWEGRG